jgi:tubulin polyglutamylase TTLL6/13
MCFEILGFDIIFDNQMKPLLLEINHSPSFNIDTPLDAKIKTAVIEDTLEILYNISEDKFKVRNQSDFRKLIKNGKITKDEVNE